MNISEAGLALIKSFEGYAKELPNGDCKAYPDPASGGDPWTIGFGSTGPDIKPGTVWTRAMADARLAHDAAKFANGVSALLSVDTTQHQFDAMTCLAYNIGLANFGKSTVLRRHNQGNPVGAANAFVMWNKAAGKVMAGLTRRREAEAELYRGA